MGVTDRSGSGPRGSGPLGEPTRAEPGASPASSPRAPTIVEFFGLPGVGKSYVAELTHRILSDLGIPARVVDRPVGVEVPAPVRIGRKLLLVAGQGLSHPVRSIRAVEAIVAAQRDLPSGVSRSVQWLVTQALLARSRRSPGVHLLQEGVLQALWSVGLRGHPDDVIASLGGDLEPVWPDIVVVVEAPIETVRARLGSRDSQHSRTERLTDDERDAELIRGEALVARLLARWEVAAGPDRLVRVYNGGDGAPDIEAILHRIAALATRAPDRRASSQ